MAQRDAKKAYQSRMQQQERLAIRYLKIGQSSQCPYYKGIKIIFQNYKKYLEDYQNLLKGDDSVIKELSVKDFYRHLYELLEHLPAQRREVFILTYIKGLTAKEVAEQIQMPQRTVESHLYLALRFLKRHMSRNDYYILCAVFLSINLVTCFYNRDFTKHYDTKIVIID